MLLFSCFLCSLFGCFSSIIAKYAFDTQYTEIILTSICSYIQSFILTLNHTCTAPSTTHSLTLNATASQLTHIIISTIICPTISTPISTLSTCSQSLYLLYFVRFILFLCILLLNSIMLHYLVRSLHEGGTLTATTINNALSFIASVGFFQKCLNKKIVI